MTKRITSMFGEDEIVALLEQHGRYLLSSGIEVFASMHGSGWYLRVPLNQRGLGVHVGRNGMKPRGQLRPFSSLATAIEAALSPANRVIWDELANRS